MVRKLSKINQVDLSSRIGISQATLSELDQDKYKPSVETIIAIVTEFGTDLEWLLLGSKNTKGNYFSVITGLMLQDIPTDQNYWLQEVDALATVECLVRNKKPAVFRNRHGIHSYGFPLSILHGYFSDFLPIHFGTPLVIP
jgi:DNA-binding XRE family transcriptional regulator